MPQIGTLRTWNDDRGYGFIAPKDGGRELFVHISAFPHDGSRPTVGETLTYELGNGKDGKPAAVKVFRQALGRPTDYPRTKRNRTTRRSIAPTVVGVLMVAAAVAYGYRSYGARPAASHSAPTEQAVSTEAAQVAGTTFRCDGRTHCSQMTSCTEAKFFLKNCPRTQMDGNNDGVPCQQQWCTSPFAK